MTSMKVRLFALLMLATSIVWLCGMAWIYSGSRQELERVLDGRLEEATRMVETLIANADVHMSTTVSGLRLPKSTPQNGVHGVNDVNSVQLACQIWSIEGKLVGRSSDAPMTQLTHISSGFSNQDINGAGWRVYAREDRERGIRVLVGDSIAHRERLVRGLMWGLALPGLVVLALLGGFIWVAIREGLAPLRRLTSTLGQRSADDLGAIDIGKTPREITPVVGALNGLFAKVTKARDHERSVTAFAAHELRTPLAGLRTQVQVALAAGDAATRETALRNALVAADRTTRMARQLLALAQIDASEQDTAQEWIDAGVRLRSICDELRTKEKQVPALIEERLFGCRVLVDPDAFHLAVRNLTENAVQHTQGPDPVRWSLVLENGQASLTLDDQGPGIPADEIELVTKRFFRGRHKSPVGSGLGLAIAETALEKDRLSLRLQNRGVPSGLRAQITLPASRVKLLTLHNSDAAAADRDFLPHGQPA